MKCGIKLVVDYAFKRTFGTEENKNVLKHLLNAVLAKVLPQPIVEIKILNPFSRKDRTDSKLTIVDIKARDDVGRDYIIEVQIYKQTYFPERLFFYGAKEYANQLSEGDDYSKLRPVIVICISETTLFESTTKAHSRFQLADVGQCLILTDTFEVHTIELGKFRLEITDLQSDEDRWIYFIQNSEEYDSESLPSALASVPEIQQASETLTMVAHSPTEREEYEASLKAKRDENARIQYALNQGRLEGRLEEARMMLIHLGQLQMGPLQERHRAVIDAMTDLAVLQETIFKLHRAHHWDEVLPSQISTPFMQLPFDVAPSTA